MNELNNWTEVTKGIYRYVIGANVCYEIHLFNWWHETDILTADAKLYIVGDWYDKDGGILFSRELLLENALFECIEEAIKDNEKNNS